MIDLQKRILELFAKGLTRSQIAERLGVHYNHVKTVIRAARR